MAKVKRSVTLDGEVERKIEDLRLSHGFQFSTMANWLLRRQLGLSGDMEVPEDERKQGVDANE